MLGATFQRGCIQDGSGRAVFARAIRPVGYFARLRGLIGRTPLTDSEAWWFSGCSAVHTFGMSCAIDVVHLADDGRVLCIRPELAPGRVSAVRRGGHVVELMAGAARRLELRDGVHLRFCP